MPKKKKKAPAKNVNELLATVAKMRAEHKRAVSMKAKKQSPKSLQIKLTADEEKAIDGLQKALGFTRRVQLIRHLIERALEDLEGTPHNTQRCA